MPELINFTPGIQALIASLPQAPQIEPSQDDGFNFGSIFSNALPFAAKQFTTGMMAAMEALDVGRQYVAKPLLGLGVYMNDPNAFTAAHGTPLSINNLRTGWDEAPLPGVLKFGLELAFDPTMYVGLGLFKTPAIRGAEALLPLALGKGVSATAVTFTQRMRMASKIDSVPGYSKLFNRFLQGGEISDDAIKAFRVGAEQRGLTKTWIDATEQILKHADPTTMKGLRGGLLTGILPKNRITSFMGQADFLAEGIWATGLSLPANAITKIPYKAGTVTNILNVAGKSTPLRGMTALMGFVGPRSWKIMDVHAAAGRLGTWGLGSTANSANRQVRRTAYGIVQGLKESEAVGGGRSIAEIASNVFYHDGAFLDDVAFATARTSNQAIDEREIFRRAVVGLRDDVGGDKNFLRVFGDLANTSEDVFTQSLEDIIRPIRFADMGVLPDPDVVSTMRFAAYDWVGKAIDHVFRPLVTTMTGLPFLLINAGDNTWRAGGVRFLGSQSADLPFMVKHGLPPEIGAAADGTIMDIFKASVKGTGDDITQAIDNVLGRKIAPTKSAPTLGEVIPLGSGDYVSSMGMTSKNLAESIPLATFFNRTIRSVDGSSQAQIALEHASRGFYKRVNDAAATGELLPLKTWFDELDSLNLNPTLKNFFKERAARFVDDPKGTRAFLDEGLSLDKLVLDDVMASLNDIPENLRLTAQWAIETNMRKGMGVYDATIAGLAQAQTNIPYYAQDALRAKVLNLGSARQRFAQVMDDILTPEDTKTMIGELTSLRQARETRSGMLTRAQKASPDMWTTDALRRELDTEIAGLTERIRQSYTPYMVRQRGAMQQDQQVIEGFMATLDAGKILSKKDLTFWQQFQKSHPLASESTDMLVYTQMSHAAQANDVMSTQMVLAYENVRLNLTDQVAIRFKSVTEELNTYKVALQTGDDLGAKTALNRLAAMNGDFKPALALFDETSELPGMVSMMGHFRASAEATMYRVQGAKLEFADTMVDIMNRGNWSQMDIAQAAKKLEQEVFQVGNINKSREFWAEKAASRYGLLGESLPHVQPQRELIVKKAAELQGMVDNALDLAGTAVDPASYHRVIRNVAQRDAGRNMATLADHEPLEAAVMRYLDETGETADNLIAKFAESKEVPRELTTIPASPAALAEKDPKFAGLLAELENIKLLEANPPIREAKEMFRDFQDNYADLGKFFYNSVKQVEPDNYQRFLGNRMRDATKRTMRLALNQDLDSQSVRKLQTLVHQLANIGDKSDVLVKNKMSALYRDAMQSEGLPAMRRYMVDYNLQTNFENVISEILPFASFQLHLPKYLASTFVHRPGVIVGMNHFTQSAQDEGMFRGGMLFGSVPGGGAMMFAPQLRFSWLPIMAGQNFVDSDDSVQNQIFDVMDLFGFMPGPHVQALTDTWTAFAEQAGIPGAKGGDRQLKYGVIPQLRWVQDITAMMGINDSRGVNLPFFGATTDVRDRAVQKNLANRVATRLAARRFELGRDLYPNEVQHIRDYVYENELSIARKTVSAMDLLSSQIPGVKVYSDTAMEVHKRVATWMTENGVEGATAKNTVQRYKELNSLQRANLLKSVPEFEDILAIPPFAETGAEKVERQARTSYFGAIDTAKGLLSATQQDLDSALAKGDINIIEWRKGRSTARSQYGAGLQGLQNVPEFKAIADKERTLPEDPADAAWTNYNAITPTDFNGNGFIDDDDYDQFYTMKDQFMAAIPAHIRNYIEERRRVSMTPLEQEYETAQDQYGVYRDIPKWVGFTADQSRRAENILRDVQVLASLSPQEDNRLAMILTMPGLSSEDRALAIQAQRAAYNPQRLFYWNDKPLLSKFYPDYAPSPDQYF